MAVVLIIPSNDSNVLRLQESYWNSSQYYANIVPSSGEFYRHNQVQKNRKDFENLLRIFSEVCRLYDIQLFVSDIMHRNEDENYQAINGWLKEICVKNHICHIDIAKQVSLHSEYFYDDRHLLPGGAQIVARSLYEQLATHWRGAYSSYLTVKRYTICKDIDLTNDISWSDKITVYENSEISLWLDLKVVKKESYNSMLYCIDYY